MDCLVDFLNSGTEGRGAGAGLEGVGLSTELGIGRTQEGEVEAVGDEGLGEGAETEVGKSEVGIG